MTNEKHIHYHPTSWSGLWFLHRLLSSQSGNCEIICLIRPWKLTGPWTYMAAWPMRSTSTIIPHPAPLREIIIFAPLGPIRELWGRIFDEALEIERAQTIVKARKIDRAQKMQQVVAWRMKNTSIEKENEFSQLEPCLNFSRIVMCVTNTPI